MDSKSQSYRKDELTLEEVILRGGTYIKALRKHYWYILAAVIIFSAASFLYYSSKPPLYKARLSFMLNEDEGSQLTSMNAILGQLGFPIVNQRINISKVLELSLSRKIVQNAIFKEIETESGVDLLANHIINKYDLVDSWSKNDNDMSGFMFSHGIVDSFSTIENKALKDLAVMIAGTPANRKSALIETDYGQNTTIMSYVTHSIDENISYHLTNNIFQATSDFYVEKSIEKQKSTYSVLSAKRDSLRKEYNKIEFQYAQLSEKSMGLFSKSVEIKRDRLRGEMLQLSSGLAKLEENIALVEFGIENNTPILQVIDAPILPLEEVSTGTFRSLLIGGVFGFAISFTLIMLLTFWQNAQYNSSSDI